jgi:hypothetical protein
MRLLLIAAIGVASLETVALAQSAAGLAGISGVVRDVSVAAVPNAKVTILNEMKGVVRHLTTNEAGLFTALQGFAPYEAKDLELLVGQNLNLAVGLTVAAGATEIEVSIAAPLVEDTKPTSRRSSAPSRFRIFQSTAAVWIRLSS